MTVRAKFYVYEIRQTPGQATITLNPVCRGEDNKRWAAATPSGKIEMTILNKLAVEEFEVGKEYYIDFTPAPQGEEGM